MVDSRFIGSTMSVRLHLPAWTLRGLRHRHSTIALTGLSFAESTVLPIPTDCLLVPLCMAKPASAWHLAGVATVASILGSVYGYALGHLGYQWVDTRYGDWVSGSWLEVVLNGFDNWGVLMVLFAALLPIPFCFVTIGAGVSGMGIVPFVAVAALGRGIQFSVVSQLAAQAGRKASSLFPQSNNNENVP